MIKTKLGPGMVSSDKHDLDRVIDEAVLVVGANYSYAFDYITSKIIRGDYSSALKANAIKKSSWIRYYVKDKLDTFSYV